MGKIVPVSLTQKSNPARFKQGGAARLMNCYVETIGQEGKVPWAIYACDGLQGYTSLASSDGGVRAMIEVDGGVYVVSGTRFYAVNTTTQVATMIGTMNISKTAPVFMERNRRVPTDIMIVCDGLAYYYRVGVSFGQVTDADLLAPTSLTFVNGYFVIGTANNKFQSGALDDASAWDPLAFGRADASPDAVLRVANYQGDLAVFGTQTIQFHRDAGTTPFPFAFIQSTNIGLLSADSVSIVEQSLAFVASDRSVRMLRGYGADKISTHAVDRAIEDTADPSTIVATSWVKDGHTFYEISSDGWTWVYDTVTGFWHERQSYGMSRWRVSKVVSANGKLIAGDRDSGILYEMDASFPDESGTELVSQITLPPVHAFPYPLTFNALYVDVEKGVGLYDGATQDVDPELMLEWSRDGGATFAGWRTLSLGKLGKALTRVRTRRIGQAGQDGLTFRLSWSARVARALYGVSADVERDAV